MESKLKCWELTYSDDFDQITGNILKVTPDFLNILQANDNITIQGNEDDDFIFSVQNNSYRLRDIFLPSTMILTPQLNKLQLQPTTRKVAYVSLQTTHYLKLQAHNIEYNVIYSELMKEAVSKQNYQESIKLWDIVLSCGISVSMVCNRFRITHSQLQQLLRHTPAIVLHTDDLPQLQEATLVVFGLDSLLIAMRHLLPFLIQQSLISQWFDFTQLTGLGIIKHQKIMHLLAKIFNFQVQGNSQSSFSISQPMSIQQKVPLKFKCKLQSIIRFVLLEHALVKHQYSTSEMDYSVWNLILTYLPVGLPEYEEDKAKKLANELIGLYFFTIPKHPSTIRVFYNPLLIGSSVKERMQFLRTLKKKFTLKQIEGTFSHMIKCQIQIKDILMKHFRKCGQEYQMKLVIPK